MIDYDKFELDCKDDCNVCNVKLECEYLTADGADKEAALKKLRARDEEKEKEFDGKDFSETEKVIVEEGLIAEGYVAEATAEEKAREEKTTEIIVETAKVEGTDGVIEEKEEIIETDSPAEEITLAAEEKAVEEQKSEEIAEAQADSTTEVLAETKKVEGADNVIEEKEEIIETDSPAEEIALAAEEQVVEEQIAIEKKEERVVRKTVEGLEEAADTAFETEEAIEETKIATEEATEIAEIIEESEEKTGSVEATEVSVETEESKAESVKTATANHEEPSESAENATEEKSKKAAFRLTPPVNMEELNEKMCTKRGRKLIFRPSEAIFDATFKVEGTDKKNEEGIKVKDILDAEIKQGVKLGYIDKFDGLKTSEIKEEYENDVVYEYADQEFKKTGLIYDGKKIKVYVYDFDGKACHHVGYLDETAAANVIPYLIDRDKYSFALDGIITGGKAKRVTKDENGKITVTKEKDGNIGLELDVTILPRKD